MSTHTSPSRRPHGRPMGGPHGMAPSLTKSKDLRGTLRRFLGEMRPDAGTLLLALLVTVAGVALNVTAPKVLGRGTDLIFNGIVGSMIAGAPSKDAAVAALRARGEGDFADMLAAMDVTPGVGIDFTRLAHVLLLVCGLYVAASLASFLAGWFIRRVVQNTGWRLRRDVQAKIERLPLSYFDRHSRGDLMSRVSNDVDNATQVLNQTLSQFFQSVLTIIGIAAMMLSLSWKLTLLALVVIPVGMVVAGVLMKRAQPQFRTQWQSTGTVSGIVEETTSGHDVMALYGLRERYTGHFDEANEKLRASSFRAQFISNLMMPLMGLISNVSYVVVAVGGGLMVARGSMTLGAVQAFIQYSRQFTQPIGQLASMANSLQSGAASAERVFEFLDADEMAPDAGSAEVGAVRGRIEFDHVGFGYDPERPVIRDLSLTVEPGQTVAIIGPTGAGKTTLVNLLMRFYEVDSGAIRIDGVDIRDLHKDALRSRFGMVLQDTWLFEGSIEENIAFGRSGASHDEVVDAATATAADRLIRQLPAGYGTLLADDADTISAGERQLLTIARAFIAQPDVLILDEATSSVDTRTEVLVQRAMGRLREGRTAFVIAHRLSTIRDADVILVMEQGDVVETGTHEELLAAGGAYARLYRAQFEGAED